MRFAVEGSGENRGLSDKLDSEEKEKITDALEDGQYWIDSNPKADVDKENGKQWTQRQLAGHDPLTTQQHSTVVEKDGTKFIFILGAPPSKSWRK